MEIDDELRSGLGVVTAEEMGLRTRPHRSPWDPGFTPLDSYYQKSIRALSDMVDTLKAEVAKLREENEKLKALETEQHK